MIAAWVAGELHRSCLISSRPHHLEKTLLRCRPVHLHRLPITLPSTPRRVLPSDLPTAIKHLNDQELEQLLAAVTAEHQRRSKRPPSHANAE
jgi:hypothetical protein